MAGYFKRDWVKFKVNHLLSLQLEKKNWDLGSSEVSEANKNPDFTAGVLMSRDKLGNYYIEDVYRMQKHLMLFLKKLLKQQGRTVLMMLK